MADLDDWLPRSVGRQRRRAKPAGAPDAARRWDHREYHERHVERPPEEALAAALAVPAEPDRIVATLFRLRGLDARDKSLEQLFSPPWATVLERTPVAFVARLNEPNGIDIVFDLRARSAGGGAILSTETRVAGGGLRFGAYWLVVRPFSGLIRRRWLAAAAKRGKQGQA